MSNNLVATGLVLSGLFVSSTVLAATQAVFPTQTSFEVSPEDTVNSLLITLHQARKIQQGWG